MRQVAEQREGKDRRRSGAGKRPVWLERSLETEGRVEGKARKAGGARMPSLTIRMTKTIWSRWQVPWRVDADDSVRRLQ